jgi:hypothetical protein
MMATGCDWRGCDEVAALLVLAGPRPSEAEQHGPFCVSHAALACSDLRREHPGPLWFDWLARQRGAARPSDGGSPRQVRGCGSPS